MLYTACMYVMRAASRVQVDTLYLLPAVASVVVTSIASERLNLTDISTPTYTQHPIEHTEHDGGKPPRIKRIWTLLDSTSVLRGYHALRSPTKHFTIQESHNEPISGSEYGRGNPV
jgi:hypothetical protein